LKLSTIVLILSCLVKSFIQFIPISRVSCRNH
jgi:hypothetical protein